MTQYTQVVDFANLLRSNDSEDAFISLASAFVNTKYIDSDTNIEILKKLVVAYQELDQGKESMVG